MDIPVEIHDGPHIRGKIGRVDHFADAGFLVLVINITQANGYTGSQCYMVKSGLPLFLPAPGALRRDQDDQFLVLVKKVDHGFHETYSFGPGCSGSAINTNASQWSHQQAKGEAHPFFFDGEPDPQPVDGETGHRIPEIPVTGMGCGNDDGFFDLGGQVGIHGPATQPEDLLAEK